MKFVATFDFKTGHLPTFSGHFAKIGFDKGSKMCKFRKKSGQKHKSGQKVATL